MEAAVGFTRIGVCDGIQVVSDSDPDSFERFFLYVEDPLYQTRTGTRDSPEYDTL
jgi:hypothetical protein